MKSIHAYNKIFYVNAGEILSGYINGESASDIEERVYRALAKRQIPSAFRFRINPLLGFTQTRMNIIGELEVDFLTQWKGQYIPILVDGEISHFMAAWQMNADAEKTFKINEAMKLLMARKVERIPFWKLKDQRMADRTISEIYDMIIPVAVPQKTEDIRTKAEEDYKNRVEQARERRREFQYG